MGDSSFLTKKSNLVLIVDDDDEVREILRVEFELEGFSVITATNGAEAVSMTHKLKPDVILIDVLMPLMDGIEATKILKDDPSTRHIPIIMITVVGGKEEIIKGLEAGAVDYITKPFFVPELKARINAVLHHKKLYDELKLLQERLVRQERLGAVSEIISVLRGNIGDKLTVISGKVELIRRNQGNASAADLDSIQTAIHNIKHTLNNLDIFEIFVPEVSSIISRIADLDQAH